MIIMLLIKKIFFISFLIESLISLMIILMAPFSVVLASSLNLLSFANVAAMGYWLRKAKIELWKIFVFGILLLVLGGSVSIIIHILSGNFYYMIFLGIMFSLVVFSPFYGVLSVLGAYIQDRISLQS